MLWIKNNPLLKIVETPVDKSVVASKYSNYDFLDWIEKKNDSIDIMFHHLDFVLHDIRVSCHGPDDRIFDANKQIRSKISRGNCIM